jgi:hypothetical protein
MDDYTFYPNAAGRRTKHKASRLQRAIQREREFGDFKCLHCKLHVSALPDLSGVIHRNHCPWCLWSRHVDLRCSGDRLSACKSPMAPAGLTFKRRHKKYAGGPGELMLLHQCTGCGGLSINRLAADDNPAAVWQAYAASLPASPALLAAAAADGIDVLDAGQRQAVWARLFGEASPAMPVAG